MTCVYMQHALTLGGLGKMVFLYLAVYCRNVNQSSFSRIK